MIKIDWLRLFQGTYILGFYIYHDLRHGVTTELKIGWSRICLRGGYTDSLVVYRVESGYGLATSDGRGK